MSLLIGIAAIALLQADPAADIQFKRWTDFYKRTAEDYAIELDTKPAQKLKLQPNSILSYTNPTRERGQHGSVFVWTLDGRPEAVATIWSIRNRDDTTKRRVAHEFHSLSLSPIKSKHSEIQRLNRNKGMMPQWEPSAPGITLTPMPEQKPPADSKIKRLFQMRQLARQFTGVSIEKDDSSTELRLLAQPLYRYDSTKAGVIDGGLFGLASGTDPEMLLMIEARQFQGKPTWHFAAARCTGLPLQLKHADKVVWQCEKAKIWSGEETYFFCIGVSEHNAILPAATKPNDPKNSQPN